MVLAVGTGRALRALPKAKQPRGGGVSSAKAEGYPASRHGDFPLRRGVMFIFSTMMLRLGFRGVRGGLGLGVIFLVWSS